MDDDATIDSDDDDNDDDQSLTEEEAAAVIEERDQKLTSLLEKKNELPLRTRNRFNELVAELLMKTKDDIHAMICENNIDGDDYQGLDSSRDTKAQVETAIRFFPEVISQQYNEEDEDGDEIEEYPIQRLCNVKAVSFIADLARLAIEFHSFDNHERGGLLIRDYSDDNTFRNLMWNFGTRPDQNDILFTVLIRLRRMGLFENDDIRDYYLVSLLCENDFPERVFQFLVEWDPTSLIQIHDEFYGGLPLHVAARRSIRDFTIVFSYVIRYYPFQKGIRLLFQKDNGGKTPLQYACEKYGRERVMEMLEEILTHYHSEGTPLHIVEALVLAATDENVHLDCSYFLLRREPDVLVRLLARPHSNNNNNNDIAAAADDDDDCGSDGGDGNHNDDNDVDDDEDDGNNKVDGDGNRVWSEGEGEVEGEGDDDISGHSKNNGAGTRKRKKRV